MAMQPVHVVDCTVSGKQRSTKRQLILYASEYRLGHSTYEKV
jgi:hypothetical protein